MSIKSKKVVDYCLYGLLALFWSGSFINIKTTVDACPEFFSAMLRVFIGFITLTIFFLCQEKKVFVSPKIAWRLWVAGIFSQAIPFAFLFYGEQFIRPALASIINSTVSIWALLLGVVFLRDYAQLQRYKVLGVIIGFIGILIVFGPMLDDGRNAVVGIVSVFAMVLSYAVGALINQHMVFGKLKPATHVNLWQQHLASFVFLLVLTLSTEKFPDMHTLMNVKVMGAFIYLGVFATAISFMIYYYLIREWDAVRASSVMYMVPMLAILWDYLFLHVPSEWYEIFGAIIILVGVMLIQKTTAGSRATSLAQK
ncbi:MAG: DMT family transporter [Gammaproteobacteria bacterium]|nr:DMT family transporter [Gammaproteobacteria bacterium]